VLAGLYLYSRRFLILVWLFPIVYLAASYHMGKLLKNGLRLVLYLTILLVPQHYPETIPLPRIFPPLSLTRAPEMLPKYSMYRSLDSANKFGFKSREQRYQVAKDMIIKSPLLPHGYGYHKIYSCEFSGCIDFDYPHFTIFSEWLGLGVVGAMLL